MVATLDQVLTEWSKDATVDESRVQEELTKTGKLQSKYVRYRAENALLAAARAVDYEKLKAVKHDYYSGVMSKEELDDRGWKPYLYSVRSKDALERCLTKDDELSKLLLTKVLHDQVVEVCTSILKELGNRTYALRGWVDYQKYLMGH